MIVSGPALSIPSVTLLEMLKESVFENPNQPAAWFGGRCLTYRELYWRTLRCMAEFEALGVKTGDCVGIMLPNCPEYVIAYYAVTGLGAVAVQVNPMSTVSELSYLLADSGARFLVVHQSLSDTVNRTPQAALLKAVIGVKFVVSEKNSGGEISEGDTTKSFSPAEQSGFSGSARELSFPVVWMDTWFGEGRLAAPPAVDPESVAVLQYTGGTTGRPKAAMLTHVNLVSNAFQARAMIPGGVTSEDKTVCALPLFHVYSMTYCMNLSILAGATMLILPRFEARSVVALFREHRPTLFPAVPTMYVALSRFIGNIPDVLSSLRVCNSGGATLPEQVMIHFERLTGAVLLEGYGLSEASPITHSNPSPERRKPGSIGLPVGNTQARIVDVKDGRTELGPDEVGELLISGPQVMKGYWQRPSETEQTIVEGWLHTGDIAKIDKDGYAYILDRQKDLIIAGGYNVYPREVEEVLYKHPYVLEAAVIGVPDDYRGETVKAFLVKKPGAQLTEDEILKWCREYLSAYKIPRFIEFREELPKSAVGKVLRRNLRNDY